jgi:FtsP/CotA-like multicopper oxidase with cupredoxin domain
MKGIVSRRDFFRLAALTAGGVATGTALRGAGAAGAAGATEAGTHPPVVHAAAAPVQPARPAIPPPMSHGAGLGAVGEVDLARRPVDPVKYLTAFDWGKVSKLPNGQTLREYRMISQVKEIEIAPGVLYPAWTYNGQVPGPTLRARQGDRLRIHFSNGTPHPHNIHFHGFHAAEMDGVEPIDVGKSFTYEFDADPFGLHLYHCHVQPLKRHIHKGLYGTFIIDPPQARPPAQELVMMMNAFDTNFDNENEMYAINSAPFYYMRHPIKIKQDELVRLYLVNITEFDPINSLHLHANFFNVYRTGTRLEPTDFTDIINLGQAERAILEFRYKKPGRFMFHAHQSEFVELGWMSFFEVTPNGV